MPVMIGASLAIAAVAWNGIISRTEGVIFLIAFALFMIMVMRLARREPQSLQNGSAEILDAHERAPRRHWSRHRRSGLRPDRHRRLILGALLFIGAPSKKSDGGHFVPASTYFTAADFHAYPVTRLVDRRATQVRIEKIVSEYRRLSGEYPYIFVIGHSSRLDDPHADDPSVEARRKRNLEYALRRASLITGLLQERLNESEIEHLVSVTTGEADLRNPADPLSQENAWVEVKFGKEWKPPSRQSRE